MSKNEVVTLSPINGAYISGLIMGWASRLEKSESTKDVINDMNEFSKILAIKSGVTLFEENNNT